jgi:hypothetical protein
MQQIFTDLFLTLSMFYHLCQMNKTWFMGCKQEFSLKCIEGAESGP